MKKLKSTKKPPSWKYQRKEHPVPPKERSAGSRPQYDWATIRDEYVNGYEREGARNEFDRVYPTQVELAEKYGCAVNTIGARAARERWSALKDNAAIELTKEVQRKRARKIAHAAIQFDDNSLKVGEMGVALIMSRLSEIATESRVRKEQRDAAIEALANGEDVKVRDLRSAVYHQEMLSLANAAEKFQQIGLRALGQEEGGNTLNVNVDASTNNTMNVAQEMVRDDKERAGALVAAFAEIGALPAGFIESLNAVDRIEREEVVDAEIVEDAEAMEPDAPEPTEAVPDGEDEEEYELDPAIRSMIDNMPTTSQETP